MVEQMERDGIVGPANGAKPRETWPARGIPAAGGQIDPTPGGLETWASGTTLSP
jgi:hypothetical protein